MSHGEGLASILEDVRKLKLRIEVSGGTEDLQLASSILTRLEAIKPPVVTGMLARRHGETSYYPIDDWNRYIEEEDPDDVRTTFTPRFAREHYQPVMGAQDGSTDETSP